MFSRFCGLSGVDHVAFTFNIIIQNDVLGEAYDRMEELKQEATTARRYKKRRASTGTKKRKYTKSRKSQKILCSHIKELINIEKSINYPDKYRIKLQYRNGRIDWVESSEIDHNAKRSNMFTRFAEKISNNHFHSWQDLEAQLNVDPTLQAGLDIEWRFNRDGITQSKFFPIVYRYKSGLEPGWLADVCWNEAYEGIGVYFPVCFTIYSMLFS